MAKIPLVLALDEEGRVQAWNNKGKFLLPDDGKEILDPGHPFLKDVMKDLVALCHHSNAGTFIISGWQLDEKLYSFPFENGAHAGPGEKETNAFALLPSDIITLSQDQGYLTTMDLREAALSLLKRSDSNLNYYKNSKRTLRKLSISPILLPKSWKCYITFILHFRLKKKNMGMLFLPGIQWI